VTTDKHSFENLFNPDDLAVWIDTSIEVFIENAIGEMETDIANIRLILDSMQRRYSQQSNEDVIQNRAILDAIESANRIHQVIKTMSAYTHNHKDS
jgi:hypothetical protein